MDSTERLRIAGLIQAGLARRLKFSIDLPSMLSMPAYAREVLFVCQGLEDPELVSLAAEYERAAARAAKPMPRIRTPESGLAAPPPAMARHAPELPVADAVPAPQDAAWARDTSGFGVTRSPEPGDEETGTARPARQWLGRWFRRETRG